MLKSKFILIVSAIVCVITTIAINGCIKRSTQKDESKNVVVFCRVGGRSEQVIKLLEQRGSRQLANLVGGTQKYSDLDERIRKY